MRGGAEEAISEGGLRRPAKGGGFAGTGGGVCAMGGVVGYV